jgi:hypothetical protein
LVVSTWSHAIMLDVDDAFDLVGSLVAALFAVGLIRHAPRRELKVEAARTRRAPRLIGGAIVSYGIGSMVWIWYAQVLSQPPFPSLADVFYLAFYPLLLAGVLCLIPRSLSPVTRTRIIFDGLMIVTAALILSWYFILGPTVLQARETIPAKIVGAAYPVADLALILCLILVLVEGSRSPGRSLGATVHIIRSDTQRVRGYLLCLPGPPRRCTFPVFTRSIVDSKRHAARYRGGHHAPRSLELRGSARSRCVVADWLDAVAGVYPCSIRSRARRWRPCSHAATKLRQGGRSSRAYMWEVSFWLLWWSSGKLSP